MFWVQDTQFHECLEVVELEALHLAEFARPTDRARYPPTTGRGSTEVIPKLVGFQGYGLFSPRCATVETEPSSLSSVVEPFAGARPTCSRAGRADDGYCGGNREVIQTSELVTKSERFFRQNPAPPLLNTAPAFKALRCSRCSFCSRCENAGRGEDGQDLFPGRLQLLWSSS